MAYEYDRFEREDGGGSFLMGLLAGTVLGAGLGMLFAPKAGSELRNQLGEQAGKLQNRRPTAISRRPRRSARSWIADAKPTIARAPTSAASTGSTGSSTTPVQQPDGLAVGRRHRQLLDNRG